MAIGAYEPGIVVSDVPSLGSCRLTPAEARAYIDLVETGAGEDELATWTVATPERQDAEGAGEGADER